MTVSPGLNLWCSSPPPSSCLTSPAAAAAAEVELAHDARDHPTRRHGPSLARARTDLDDAPEDGLAGRDGEVVVALAEPERGDAVVLREEAGVDLERDGAAGGRAVLDVDERERGARRGEDGAAEAGGRGLDGVVLLVRGEGGHGRRRRRRWRGRGRGSGE